MFFGTQYILFHAVFCYADLSKCYGKTYIGFLEGSVLLRIIIIALLVTLLLISLLLTPLDFTAIWVSSPLGFGTDSTDVSFSLILLYR